MNHERWILEFEPAPSSVPVTVRVRSLLKVALRSFGLRCVHVETAEREQHAAKQSRTNDLNPTPF
jgi:hypothetical protein